MRTRCGLWLAAIVLVATPIDAGEWITLAVSPRQSFGPTNMTVQVRLQPSADNRVLEVVADSADFFTSSQIQLEGDQAPKTILVELRAVPSGAYEVSGTLFDSLGHPRAGTRQHALVLPSGRDR